MSETPVEDAIFQAFCARHRCVGMGGAALSARFSLAISCAQGTTGPLEQAERLRAWADVLRDAARRVEQGSPFPNT